MRFIMALVVTSLVSVAGCYRPLEISYGDGDEPHDMAKASCASITTQAECAKRADCAVGTCPGCKSSEPPPFVGCYDKGGAPPVCPASPCPLNCEDLTDAVSCKAAGCTIYDCCGFKSCHTPGSEIPICAADCAPTCELYDEATCKAYSGTCHPVYEGCYPNESCTNQPVFKTCGQWSSQCDGGTSICDALPPSCPPGYVPGLANGCWEGCVEQASCCNPGCSKGSTCDACWGGYSCVPDGAAC